jgi:hypothetical protein
MKYRVEWTPSAEQDLAAIWMAAAADKAEVTTASNNIDAMLARDPLSVGESRVGASRILISSPLAVAYDVVMDDVKVIVWDVWRWTSPSS